MSATLTPVSPPPFVAPATPEPTPPPPPNRSRFRPDIEGMRGIAVLLVVLFHAGVTQLPGGFVGVDVFFVISGFLITRLLVDELARSGRISLKEFYLRRTRRLLPALAVVTSATVLCAAVVLSPLDAARVGEDGIWASLYLANVNFMQAELNYFAPSGYESPLLHIWSLAVEEQFYVVWPLVLMAAAALLHPRARRSFGVILLVATVASFVASVALTTAEPAQAYFSPLTRAWELGLGGLIAIWWAFPPERLGRAVRSVLAFAGVAGIVFGATMLSEQTPFPGAIALVPVGGAALLLLTAPGTFVGRMLAFGPLQRVGTISYSLYLWHWPVLVLGPYMLPGRSSLEVGALLVGVSVLLAWLTYRFIENPIRNDAWLKHSARRGLGLAIVCMVLPIALSAAVVVAAPNQGTGAAVATPAAPTGAAQLEQVLRGALVAQPVPRNLNPSLQAAEDDLPLIYRNGCNAFDPLGAGFEQRCVFGAAGADQRIVLFGDSHAGHWFPAVETLAEQHGWRLTSLTRDTCPPMRMSAMSEGRTRRDACMDWRVDAVERIRREQPAVVLVSGAWHYCDEQESECVSGMRATISELRSIVPEAQLIMLHATPVSGADVPTCLSAHTSDASACSLDQSASMASDDVAQRLRDAAEQEGAEVVRADRWVCVDGRCPVVVGNLLVYRDGNHFSTPFSRWLAPVLEEKLAASTDLRVRRDA